MNDSLFGKRLFPKDRACELTVPISGALKPMTHTPLVAFRPLYDFQTVNCWPADASAVGCSRVGDCWGRPRGPKTQPQL